MEEPFCTGGGGGEGGGGFGVEVTELQTVEEVGFLGDGDAKDLAEGGHDQGDRAIEGIETGAHGGSAQRDLKTLRKEGFQIPLLPGEERCGGSIKLTQGDGDGILNAGAGDLYHLGEILGFFSKEACRTSSWLMTSFRSR